MFIPTETKRISGDGQVALGPGEQLNLLFLQDLMLDNYSLCPHSQNLSFQVKQMRLFWPRMVTAVKVVAVQKLTWNRSCSGLPGDFKHENQKKKKGNRSILAHAWMPPKTRGLAWQGRHRMHPLLEKRVWARKVFSHYVHQQGGFTWKETIYDAGLNVASQWLIRYLRAEAWTSLKEKEKLLFC